RGSERPRPVAPAPASISLGSSAPSEVVSEPRTVEASFVSASLGREMAYAVFLPPGYDSKPGARYPVLYMLHGLGGDHSQWMHAGLVEQAADLMRRGEIEPFIIVLPDGESGYWMNHAGGGPRFGSYISSDLVSLIDRNYRTVGTRDGRAIGGMSMGGQGALQLALNNPDEFRTAGAHSVALRTKEQAFDFFGDRTYFEAHDPVSLVRSHPAVARRLVIAIDIGDADPWSGAAEAFHRSLTAQGIVHQWHEAPGGHDEAYWHAHVDDYLRFYSQAFRDGRLSGGE
ncbi:MAG: alpha/beta hydrolase family protein, partial [Dehalococcoidia bacterium]